MTETQHSWLAALSHLAARKVPCVLVTVTEAKGSTPREAGAKMVVTADAQFCTIGGGNLEFEAIAAARAMLQTGGGAPETRKYPLGPALAQCCGGAVTVLLEPFAPTGKVLYLFGAGHVGREVVGVLSGLNVDIKWVDTRADIYPPSLPDGVEKCVSAAPPAFLKDAPDGGFVVVMTHDHDLDYDIVRAAFEKGGFEYVGLIGSATKRAKFERRLREDGISAADIDSLVCPVGVAGVTGKHPREIAVAVAAQLLQRGLARADAA